MSDRSPFRASMAASLAVLALLAGACAQTPTAPSASSAVLSKGAVPQEGVPPAVPLPSPVALGATRFVSFGDSITCGVVSSFDGTLLFVPSNCTEPTFSYPRQLQQSLRGTFPSQPITVANEGSPAEEVLIAGGGRFGQTMAAVRPQGVLILEGINDLNNGRSVGSVVNGLAQMVDTARLYSTTVLIGTMFQTCVSTDPNTGRVRLNSTDQIVPFNNAIKAMAAGRQNVYVVDIYAAFGNNCGSNGGVNLVGGDGLHPSPNGYSVMAGAFANAIKQVWAVRGSFE